MYYKYIKKMNIRGFVWYDIKILIFGVEEYELNFLIFYDLKYFKFFVNEL